MSAVRAERRRDELRELVRRQVDVRYLGHLDAHEVGMEAPLHGQVAHHHQASRLTGATRNLGDRGWGAE